MHICIIPAKLDSKRVSQKNIRIIDGKPIICHVIRKLVDLKLFDQIIISTDSEVVANVVENEEVYVYKRVSTNDQSISDVILECTNNYQKGNRQISFISCCFPTALLLKEEYIIECCSNVTKHRFNSSLLLKKYSHPIERALTLDSSNLVTFSNAEFMFTRTQDLPVSYFDSGQFYCVNASKFYDNKSIFMANTKGVVERNLDSVDVDVEEDWNELEKLYLLKK